MKLTFLYAPVTDLAEALHYYRDELGWEEAWREGDSTVVFAMPDTEVQTMVSVDTAPAGPMYLVDDVTAHLAAHPALGDASAVEAIPDGHLAVCADPAGNVFYLLDQSDAA